MFFVFDKCEIIYKLFSRRFIAVKKADLSAPGMKCGRHLNLVGLIIDNLPYRCKFLQGFATLKLCAGRIKYDIISFGKILQTAIFAMISLGKSAVKTYKDMIL